ncbi:MAG: hypothetical protein MI923_20580 [Phycisphaerales bacterium]|nr:hypothetical protein [Phycisphaerales bacterium]
MNRFRTTERWLRFLASIAALSFATASSAYAQFDVPDSCRAGEGTYTGDLEGTCSYTTCLQDGIEKLDIRFDGAWAVKTSGFPDVSAVTYTERVPDAGGAIVFSIRSPTTAADIRESIDAQFGDCGIVGDWTMVDLRNNNETITGTFQINGTGRGEDCILEPSGGLCGTTGGVGLMAPLLAGAAVRRRRTAR